MDTLKRFIHYYKPYRTVFFLDLLCAAVISLIDLVYPQILRAATNSLFTRDSSTILKMLLPIGSRTLSSCTPSRVSASTTSATRAI